LPVVDQSLDVEESATDLSALGVDLIDGSPQRGAQILQQHFGGGESCAATICNWRVSGQVGTLLSNGLLQSRLVKPHWSQLLAPKSRTVQHALDADQRWVIAPNCLNMRRGQNRFEALLFLGERWKWRWRLSGLVDFAFGCRQRSIGKR